MSRDAPPSDFDIELKLLLEAIYLKYHYDFRRYSPPSLKRRLRQAKARFGVRSLSALQERVLREPNLFHDLLEYLTVQVSEMFRDPPFWRALREEIVPILKTYPSLRIWIAGCATGEECWSMAILLREQGLLERTTIYATDISHDALNKAKAGVYDLDRMAAFSEAYRAAGGRATLSDYFTTGYDRAVFDKSLAKNMVYSDHSLATDSVFAEVQLITCRNVLIYFDRELQERAVGLFVDSLCRRGFLGLGSKETLSFSRHADSFEVFRQDERIYRKR